MAISDTTRLLTSKEVAGMLAVSESTLSRWREHGTGPRYLSLGGIFRYTVQDVQSYIEGARA
ncbi:helix-turn-helix domain-containing protein [Microbacterium sp. LWS13-1.2]